MTRRIYGMLWRLFLSKQKTPERHLNPFGCSFVWTFFDIFWFLVIFSCERLSCCRIEIPEAPSYFADIGPGIQKTPQISMICGVFTDDHGPLFGPSGESRTHGLLNPIQARDQTALHPVTRGLAVTSRYYYTRRSQKVKGESSKKFNFFEDSVFCVLPLCVLDRPEVPDAAGNRKGKSGRLGDPERIPYPRNAPQPAKSPGQGQQQNQLTQQ